MTEPDVLRLARDEHLKLTVNLVNYAYGLCGPVVPRSQAKTMEVESPDGQGFTSIEGIMLSKDEVTEIGDKIVSIKLHGPYVERPRVDPSRFFQETSFADVGWQFQLPAARVVLRKRLA